MAIFGSSLTSPSSGLTAADINKLIQATLDAQRGPIRTLTAQKDQLNIRKAVYSDLKTKLLALEDIIEDLDSSDYDTVFDDITATSSDTDVLTASVASGATNGTYTIDVNSLATAHKVRSASQTSSSDALNKSGTFTLNGVSITVETTDSLMDIRNAINSTAYTNGKEITASILTAADTENYLIIEAASTGASNAITYTDTDGILSDLGMLSGEGSFADIAPFSLVALDATISGGSGLDDSVIAAELSTKFANEGITLSGGAAVTVVEANERWQITDNGRTYYVENYEAADNDNRLEIYTSDVFTFVAQDTTISGGSGLDNGVIATELDTEFANNGITLSAGAVVTVVQTNERWQITDNGKTYYVENYDAGANNNKLRVYTDSEPLQAAADASFTVDDITITRGSNTGLDDVITGVTLNLLDVTHTASLSDTIELEIAVDYTGIETEVTDFVDNLNDVLDYLKSKTQTIADTSAGTYTRAPLAGETIFSMLRSDLLAAVQKQITGGSLEYLREIGITIGDGLEISLDTAELNTKLQSNFEGVKDLFDGVMAEFLSKLEAFTVTTSSSNTIELYSDSVDTRIENIENRIERMEKMLELKEEMLIQQYSSLYTQSMQMNGQRSMLGVYYSSFFTTA